jgi:hypothetical protein
MDQFNTTVSNKKFSIPLIRMLAANASANGGKSIIMNPGGPGGTVGIGAAVIAQS